MRFIVNLWSFIFLFGVTTFGGVLCCVSFFFDGTSLATSNWHRNLICFIAGAVMLTGGAKGLRWWLTRH